MTAIPIPVIEAKADKNPRAIDAAALQRLLDDKGALLLRGFDFGLENFEAFSRNFCGKFHIPATRAARRQAQGDTFSTEVFRDNYSLLGHTEGTYKPHPAPPEICFFMCVTPPDERGGETTAVDGIEFLRRLPPDLRRRFEEEGITYEMTWDRQRWQDEFEIDDVNELKALLDNLPTVRYTLQGEELNLFYTTKAVKNSRQGDPVFATALLAHLPRIAHPGYADKKGYAKPSNRVFFGGGEEIPDETVSALIDIHDSLAYPHVWQAQDALVLDNTRYLHGRTTTERDCVRVLVSRFGWFKT
jgi:alpha-ketoglutarate-dependent taurine dioxygenase